MTTPAPIPPITVNGHTFEMLPVEGDTFNMGDEHGDLWSACRPVHEVTVRDFYIGKYPVTQALWKAVTGEENNPSFFTGDQRPVEQVSWDDAQIFIKKLNDLTKNTRPANHFYRLPTEAEWEFAARGGNKSRGYKYAGSDKLKEVGWFADNSHGETKPVGLKDSNELDIFDMSGNVWEWCEDDWHNNYNGAPTDGSAWIDSPKRGAYRVYRGGSWLSDAQYCRAAYRYSNTPDYRWYDIGFRLVLSLQSVG